MLMHIKISRFVVLFVLAGITCFAQRDKKKPTVISDDFKQTQAEALFVEGEKYFILEDYSKALLFFQRVVELTPDDPGAHFKVAETLAKSTTGQDINMAIASIETALKLEKKNKYYYQLASELYANQQNFSKAAATLETMMQENPGTEDALFDQAAYLVYANKPSEALKIYNKAEATFGVNEMSSLQKQRILLEAGQVNEAIQETEKLIKAFPDEPQYVMAFAEMLNQNGQRARAIQYLEKFDAENPGNGNARMLLSAMYKESGQSEKGNALLNSVFDDPNVEVTGKLLVIGALTAEIQQAQEKESPNTELEKFAFSLFQKLEIIEPTNDNVSLVGADLYFSAKRNKEAKFYYRKAIKQGASGFDPWQNLLVLESQDNQYDSLIAHSDEGLELFPNQGSLYYFNGYGHLRKKHYLEAAQAFEQAKKLSTGNEKLMGDINGMLGDAYNASRQYEKSDQAYEDALVINPNNDFVLNNYSYYLSLRKEKLDKAETMAAKLVKLFPENATYLDTYGWVLYVREKYKDARKVMEKVTAMSQANATHFEHFGDILFQLGDVEGAVRQWEKARGLSTNNESLNKKIANRKLN
jgi:tetratricopeptide (TPR) repeat protein